MIKQLVKFSVKNMKYRKLRAYLTMLGIVIGICALVSLITLGQGLENSITSQFDKFGSNILWIGPKSATAFSGPTGTSTLTEDDINFVDRLPRVKYAQGMLSQGFVIRYDKEKKFSTVTGFSLNNFEESFRDTGTEMDSGRFLNENDRGTLIIGYKTAKDSFDKEIRVRNKLEIEGEKFEVVGILEEQGDDTDRYIVMSLNDLWDLTDNEEKSVSALSATIEKGVEMEKAAKDLERQLERKRGEDDFIVTNPKKVAAQISEIMGAVRYVLIGIVLISLFVGGLGIMNSMYTSVLERTRDIGIMKSIGATNKTILQMYLIESGFLGLVGGLIGVVLGVAIAKGVEFGLVQGGINLLQVEISISVVIFSLAFSFIVGVVSGILPAIKASKMQPVKALRYE